MYACQYVIAMSSLKENCKRRVKDEMSTPVEMGDGAKRSTQLHFRVITSTWQVRTFWRNENHYATPRIKQRKKYATMGLICHVFRLHLGDEIIANYLYTRNKQRGVPNLCCQLWWRRNETPTGTLRVGVGTEQTSKQTNKTCKPVPCRENRHSSEALSLTVT